MPFGKGLILSDGFFLFMATKKNRQTNTVAWSTPPATAATTALQGMVDKGPDYSTPIRNVYAREEQQYNQSFKNPLGAYTTADVRDKSIREHGQMQQQNLGLDLSNAAQQEAQAKFGRQATVAGLTSPHLYQSGSSQPFTGGDILGLGANIASGIFA